MILSFGSITPPRSSGVYAIFCHASYHFYIGSSVNLHKRKSLHFSKLSRGIHNNSHLQSAVTLYGLEQFEFIVVEIMKDKQKLIEREQLYMNLLKPEYNMKPNAENNLGHKWPEESRRRFSEYHKNNPITPDRRAAMMAAPQAEEVRAKMSASHKGKTLPSEQRKRYQNQCANIKCHLLMNKENCVDPSTRVMKRKNAV